jgi:hypothetical protein
MGEQQRAQKFEGITFRCKPCSRSLGHHAPALAILERVEGPRRWAVHQVVTWGRGPKFHKTRLHPGSVRILTDVLRRDGPVYNGGGVELECRRCPNKPRCSARTLYTLADQATAEDVFV